jgi:predicted PurR-regulated permease PerM
MFISVLFLPLMRWLQKKKFPGVLNVAIVILIVVVVFWGVIKIMILSSTQVLENSDAFLNKAESKIDDLVVSIESLLGINVIGSKELFSRIMHNVDMAGKFGPTLEYFRGTLTMILMTAFFVILWLAESINVEQIIKSMMTDHKFASVKTFMEIEKNLITFVKVKVVVSFLIGLGVGLICYFFDVSFPIFWGLFALLAVYIQMIGPLVQVVLLALFALVELDMSTKYIFFLISMIFVHVLVANILEPIFMGKSFSINVITILVMLMLWGYIWGIPGMILSIPITVLIKIILEQFPSTKGLAILMSGKDEFVKEK